MIISGAPHLELTPFWEIPVPAAGLDFCDWARAWSEFVGLRDKAARLDGLEAGDVDRVKQLRTFLTRVIDRGAPYPEIRRLRTDLVDLLPADQKTDNDLAQAQRDRVSYAIKMDPEKQKLPRDQVEFVTFAEARPAIPIGPANIADQASDTWRSVLAPHHESIATAAKATGFVRIRQKDANPIWVAAVAVAPRVLLTVGFGFGGFPDRARFPRAVGADLSAEFSFGNRASLDESVQHAISIDEILFPSADGANIALLGLADHDTLAHPPLRIQRSQAVLEAAVERYVFAVGYPARDTRVPAPFLDALLNGSPDSVSG